MPKSQEWPLIREMEIVRDRHIEKQGLLLKDHRYAVATGLRRVAQHDRRSIDGDRTRIRPHSAGEDLHERGLAGAVLADQPNDLVRADGDRRVAERLDRTEALADVFDLQHERAYLMVKEPLRRIDSATAAMIISPCTVSWMYGEIPRRTMPLASTATMSTPTSEFATPPHPPVSAVPPTTTAVTVMKRRPSAMVVFA